MFPENREDLRYYYGQASLSLIAYMALIQVLSIVVTLSYYFGMVDFYDQDWYYYLMNVLLLYPAGFLVFGIMLRRFPVPKIAKAPMPQPKEMLSCVITALGMLYASSILTNLLLAGTDTVDYANETVAEQPLMIALVFTVLLAPIFEELIFRWLLLDHLLFLGDSSALLISALFFGLFHTNLYQFFYAFAVGLVLGYVRIMTGRVFWNILLHMFINLFCGILPSYLPMEEWIDMLLGLVVLGSIAYAIFFLVRKRPWRNLYPGPTSCSSGDKLKACLTSVTFWICVLLHLGLSVFYITY